MSLNDMSEGCVLRGISMCSRKSVRVKDMRPAQQHRMSVHVSVLKSEAFANRWVGLVRRLDRHARSCGR